MCNCDKAVMRLQTPLSRGEIGGLNAGDMVTLSGEVLVFRDQVHQMLNDLIRNGEPLPFDLMNQALYYCGPTPPRHGMPVGSAGPTTSSRMDAFTGLLLERGLLMTIGKGNRSREVADMLKKHGAVYMAAVGGAGALIARHVLDAKVIAYQELGPEAARLFTVVDFPLIVGIDSKGKSAFVTSIPLSFAALHRNERIAREGEEPGGSPL